jgi:hypothetical protein
VSDQTALESLAGEGRLQWPQRRLMSIEAACPMQALVYKTVHVAWARAFSARS